MGVVRLAAAMYHNMPNKVCIYLHPDGAKAACMHLDDHYLQIRLDCAHEVKHMTCSGSDMRGH